MMEQIRQGDLLFVRVARVPAGAERMQPGPRGYVLAEGEATGHAHVLDAQEGVEVWTLEGALFAHVGAPVEVAPVRHEEHDAAPLTNATWYVARQVEYRRGAIVRVFD